MTEPEGLQLDYISLCEYRAQQLGTEARSAVELGMAESAGRYAKHAATWALRAHPEWREDYS